MSTKERKKEKLQNFHKLRRGISHKVFFHYLSKKKKKKKKVTKCFFFLLKINTIITQCFPSLFLITK